MRSLYIPFVSLELPMHRTNRLYMECVDLCDKVAHKGNNILGAFSLLVFFVKATNARVFEEYEEFIR